jgi:arsenate reductase-like glutaredoxin family protein
VFDVEELIDKDGKQYRKRNLEFITHNVEEELLEDALLFKTPIVRNGSAVTLGNHPDTWKNWIE